MRHIKGIKLYIHPTFNHSIKDMPQEIEFDLGKDEKILKLIPIIKDIDNPDNLSNKFRLGIITTTIKTTSNRYKKQSK